MSLQLACPFVFAKQNMTMTLTRSEEKTNLQTECSHSFGKKSMNHTVEAVILESLEDTGHLFSN